MYYHYIVNIPNRIAYRLDLAVTLIRTRIMCHERLIDGLASGSVTLCAMAPRHQVRDDDFHNIA